MATEFTVLISSETDISLDDMGKLLNMIETRGIVIEELHGENLLLPKEDERYAVPDDYDGGPFTDE